MKAIEMMSIQRQDVLREYQFALRLWSETKALYPAGSSEVAAATKRVMELEGLALALRNAAVAKNEVDIFGLILQPRE